MKTIQMLAIIFLSLQLKAQVSFKLASSPTSGTGPTGIAATDVNGDGKTDLICANYYNNSLSILTNNANGGFVLATNLGVGSYPFSVIATNVNGDSKVDLICLNTGDSSVSVFTNNGNGGFRLSGTYQVGIAPASLIAADVNGDGKVDLISANWNSGSGNTLTVLTNNGSGGFVLASSPVVGNSPVSVVAADVNGDGKMDLISANWGFGSGNTLTVLTNNGSGGFVLASSPVVGNWPQGVTAADVNGDGKVDLISSIFNGNALSVMTNNGSGGFVLATNLSVGSNPNPVLAADINGDGKVDLISPNGGGSTLSVFTNATPFPPVISAQGPAITNQPTSQTVWMGSNVTFTVGVSGTGPLSYQWLLNSNPIAANGIITAVVGKGTGTFSGDGGAATNAGLNGPLEITSDASGNLFITDSGNNRVRKVNTNGIITTVAGGGTDGLGDGGAATNATFNYPAGVAVDASGNLFIVDNQNFRVRKVDTNGIITTVAGGGAGGGTDGLGDGGAATNATLYYPDGLTLDASGELFIGDWGNSRVRKVDNNGIITTVAGGGAGGGTDGLGDGGAATNATLNGPVGLAFDSLGNLFIGDTVNNRVRKVDTNGVITTVAGGGNGGLGDGGAATNASLNIPNGVALDAFGNLFIADTLNNRIREVHPNGIITTVSGGGAGGGTDGIGDGGLATNATLSGPQWAAVDGSGNLLITDYGHNRIRKVPVNFDNSPILTLSSVTISNAGNYQVLVVNPYGSITSSVATLTVLVPPRAATGGPQLVNGFVVGVNVTDSGYGYTNTPLVRIIGGGGSGAQATAVVSNGMVTAINITAAGSGYTATPIVVVEPPVISNPVLGIAPISFLAFSNLTVGITYQPQQVFAWYWSNQPVNFIATNTAYTQIVAGVANGGNNRLAVSPVPSQAFATAQLINGFVVGANVTANGSGYTTPPTVNIVGGGGSNATAISQIGAGSVTNITITATGSGYTNVPIVQIDPPPVAAVSPTAVLPGMRVDAASLAPYDSYQLQFKPDISTTWQNWNNGLFDPTAVTNSQFILITNCTGFFRVQYLGIP